MKRFLRKLIGSLWKVLPPGLCEWILERFPRILSLGVPGIVGKFPGYCGEFVVELDGRYTIERAMARRNYEPEIQMVIAQHVPHGAVCFDIGANVGAVTFMLARQAGLSGKVYALEPSPVIRDRLTRNLGLNPRWREVIQPVPLGLSDQPGKLFWTMDYQYLGNGVLGTSGEIEVQVSTLDHLVDQLKPTKVDFVKIDVEGMELKVIRGALSTLERFRPVILFETVGYLYRAELQKDFEELLQLLSRLGYQLWGISRKAGVLPFDRNQLCHNTLAVPGKPSL